MKLDRKAIETILPHRDPILLVNDIDITESGLTGCCSVVFRKDQRIWDMHNAAAFSDELILEAAAQLLGVILSTDNDAKNKTDENSERLLLSFDRIEFHDSAEPDQLVRLSARVVSRFGAMSAGDFTAKQQNRLLANGKIVVMGG